MRNIKLSDDRKNKALNEALDATEPVDRDVQEMHELFTTLSSQAIPMSDDNIFAVILNNIHLNLSFVNSFVLNSADHLSGISK
ncbi:hypothetical protein H1Q59_01570 [Holosporaceae bacterium 'Namur']|nr:hypothetical protein [Holosporaceae bacterium 'Namur']